MQYLTLASLLVSALGLAEATPVAPRPQAKAPYFFLIGDSTVATDGGWGDGLVPHLVDSAKGENLGVGGKTTVTWKDSGRWDALIKSIGATKDAYEPIVTIQFGHNDQKVMETPEFQTNLESIVADLTAAGATPILVTSLTRRKWKDGKVIESLSEESAATIAAAEKTGVKYIDLNRASTDYVQAIGQENAAKYDYVSGDATHLNPSGEVVFARMVIDLLKEAREDFGRYFDANKALSRKIAKGKYASGNE